MPSNYDRTRPQMPNNFATSAMGAGLARLLWVAGRSEESASILASVEGAAEPERAATTPRQRVSRKEIARLLRFAVRSA